MQRRLARALTIPLCELYAVVWRAGVVEIVDRSTADASRR
ncbi:MAG: Rv1535 domain-containing protein [Mycobacterium sp.]